MAAKHFGATVTGVCSSANIPLAQQLGCHRVLDYTRRESLKEQLPPGFAGFDVAIDCVSGESSRVQPLMKVGGRYVTINPTGGGGGASGGGGAGGLLRAASLMLAHNVSGSLHYEPVMYWWCVWLKLFKDVDRADMVGC